MTHPSLEKALDEINPRDTNPWEILDNKWPMIVIGMEWWFRQ
jgi:hypothetical protein